MKWKYLLKTKGNEYEIAPGKELCFDEEMNLVNRFIARRDKNKIIVSVAGRNKIR